MSAPNSASDTKPRSRLSKIFVNITTRKSQKAVHEHQDVSELGLDGASAHIHSARISNLGLDGSHSNHTRRSMGSMKSDVASVLSAGTYNSYSDSLQFHNSGTDHVSQMGAHSYCPWKPLGS